MATYTYYWPDGKYLPNEEKNPNFAELLDQQWGYSDISMGPSDVTFALWTGAILKFLGENLEYQGNGLIGTGGTLTGIELRDENGTLYQKIDLTGGNVNLADFTVVMETSNSWSAVYKWLFSGDDTITGTIGDDDFLGGGGSDTLIGGGSKLGDFFQGGAGIDTYVTNSGEKNTLSFSDAYGDASARRGVTVDADLGTATDPWANAETFVGMTTFHGSQFADTLYGSGADETFRGLGGRDIIDGRAGFDWVEYQSDAARNGPWGVTVNLATGYAIDGFAHRDTLTGIEGVRGTDSNDTLIGNSDANTLIGLEGDDFIDGGAGADVLSGGSGSDTYVVDNTGDTLQDDNDEWATDSVRSSVSFSLANTAKVLGNIENLTLTGNAAIDATGNAGNNVLTGNSGANVLSGGAGNDTYIVGAGDKVNEASSSGTDLVKSSVSFSLANTAQAAGDIENLTLTGSAAIAATGNAKNNVLTGNSGANVLSGGAGNDTYVVGAGDKVDETGSSGTDLVKSSVTFRLTNTAQALGNIENLTLTGWAAISATGNALNNVLTGNEGANTLSGLAGNDTYVVGAGDFVDESVSGSAGTDLVKSSVSFSLSNAAQAAGSIENLTLTGWGAYSASGNRGNNVLIGNDNDNMLNGAAGNDTLTGGSGADIFKFNSALSATTNVDKITDFTIDRMDEFNTDSIRLENGVFTALAKTGVLASGAFFKSASGVAHDADDRVIYETDTGKLFYDSNGNAAGGAVHFATLSTNLALTNADFFIV
ncbi:calcium-binding protein [Pararhizobium sp. YC-54]|uniref:beta strand repeat-containing protein n=1 Tax=Pararhizobium sp. YC-54 TaxID=2986920 RepID=UPI0021F6D0E7|nr:calcium-binding protein [Pararhizobium sp. YC-54]MCW0000314.1 calcium-binding protein [Pararhizobium sp. YC-54]